MMQDPFLLFQGLEHMVAGIVAPFLVALGACLLRVAYWGWQGFKAFAANFTIAFVLGMGAHWITMDMDLGDYTRLAITLAVTLISRDWLDIIFSARTRAAIQDRLAHEIDSCFRRRTRRDAPRRAPEMTGKNFDPDPMEAEE